ncbi:MAG: Crp/Fnr family transcriptional regulator [Actinomycetota bacterium]
MAGHHDEKVEYLSKVPMFSACNQKELRRVASAVDRVDVPKGEVLMTEGTPGHDFFVIVDGKAKVTLRDHHLATLGPGEFLGEMALLDQGPRSATAVAQTPMTLLVLTARDFSRILEEVPVVTKKIMRGMAGRLREIDRSPAF